MKRFGSWRPSTWLRALFAAALVPLAAAAQPDPHTAEPASAVSRPSLEEALQGTSSPDRAVRVRAIRDLRYGAGPEAVEALSRLLFDAPDDPAVREENWTVAAWTLARVATAEPLPEPLVARLRELASMQPTVTEPRVIDRIVRDVPKFDFATEASEALASAAFSAERRELESELPARGRGGADWLAEAAWADPAGGGDTRRRAAQAALRKQGARGLEATRKRVGAASEQAQLDMVRYAKDVCSADPDARCLPVLSALLDSTHGAVAPQVWLAIGDLALPGASELAVEKLEARGVRNDAFTRSGLNALGRLRDTRSLPFLQRQLGHREGRVSSSAARALVELGEPGKQALISNTRSADARRRRAAILELSKEASSRRDPRAVEAVEKALQAHPEDLHSDELRGLRK